jgi:hypothetical protein
MVNGQGLSQSARVGSSGPRFSLDQQSHLRQPINQSTIAPSCPMPLLTLTLTLTLPLTLIASSASLPCQQAN